MANFPSDCGRAFVPTSLGRAASSLLVNRRSSTSSVGTLDSFTSVRTALPEYSITEDSSSLFDSSSFPGSALHSTASEVTLAGSRPLPAIPNAISVPPRYSVLSQRSLSQESPNGIQENTGRSHIEHSFPIRNNKPWATLLTFTPKSVPGLVQEPRAKSKVPRFLGSEPITGMIELDLERSQTIQQISITLRGKIVTGSLVDEAQTFLEYKNILWHKSKGDPPSSSTPSVANKGKKTLGKFLGAYQFPFSFPFPTCVNIASYEAVVPDGISPFSLATTSSPASNDPLPASYDISSHSSSSSKKNHFQSPSQRPEGHAGTGKDIRRSLHTQTVLLSHDETTQNPICPTPQSFVEPGVSANVRYELVVDIVHGFLKPDSRITTNVSYLPCISSSLPSVKRLVAQENNALAPGPILDPDGWFALSSSVLRGLLGGEGARGIKIDCSLYLAKPLSYTRGTFIPCYLKLSSEDSDALNLLSTPNAPSVRLVRRLRHLSPRGGDVVSEINIGVTGDSLSGMFTFPPVIADGKGSTLKTVIIEVAEAVWWVPPKDVPQEPYIRYLEGEIHLAHGLEPSCACSLFQIEYFVEMLPFISTGFKPAPHEGRSSDDVLDQALVAHPVNIATIYTPDAPLPVPLTEPPAKKRRTVNLRHNSNLTTLPEKFENSGGNLQNAMRWNR
ncbi:hypothetical protein GALMADRAFT_244088 [Galerina marginata CBS 339.88]|uniref:Arrestin-like N-terminal domain-containing protein n=1 Tax=Galerina marginata (strain CBS 339.88) TaxID=685588 RepID=A0A067T8D8_GALM3|nr:hypothetical protein GALMADRAFT_244088 [Galerina marginata CBS 339.88]